MCKTADEIEVLFKVDFWGAKARLYLTGIPIPLRRERGGVRCGFHQITLACCHIVRLSLWNSQTVRKEIDVNIIILMKSRFQHGSYIMCKVFWVGLCILVYLYLYFVYYCLYLCSLPVCILVNKAVYIIRYRGVSTACSRNFNFTELADNSATSFSSLDACHAGGRSGLLSCVLYYIKVSLLFPFAQLLIYGTE